MERGVSPKRFTLFALFLISAGIILFLWGQSLPPFVDAARADAAFANWCSFEGHTDDKVGAAYFALMTYRYPLMDGGRGLISGGLALLALVAALFRRAGSSWLRTPAHRWAFLAIGVGVLIALWGAIVRSIVVDEQRALFPACADSIGIPLMGTAIAFVVMIPFCLALGFSVSRWFGALPAPLCAWDRTHVRHSWFVTIVFGALFLALLILVSAMAFTSAWPWTPAGVVALYLVESSRSALLSPRNLSGSQ